MKHVIGLSIIRRTQVAVQRSDTSPWKQGIIPFSIGIWVHWKRVFLISNLKLIKSRQSFRHLSSQDSLVGHYVRA